MGAAVPAPHAPRASLEGELEFDASHLDFENSTRIDEECGLYPEPSNSRPDRQVLEIDPASALYRQNPGRELGLGQRRDPEPKHRTRSAEQGQNASKQTVVRVCLQTAPSFRHGWSR